MDEIRGSFLGNTFFIDNRVSESKTAVQSLIFLFNSSFFFVPYRREGHI